jgi:bifunctional non-homologous end joining protein LigD
MSLKRYREKRDFETTPEPSGKVKPTGDQHRFVVHEHHALRLHFDLRLEIDEVLKSWAVPKGPSMNPSEKRLAVQVEDHPIDYLTFEGEIPPGEYGAGRVYIWDTGTFELKGLDVDSDLSKGRLEFILNGNILQGGFALVEMKGRRSGDKRLWLLIKMKDRYADPDWTLVMLEPEEMNRSSVKKAKAATGRRAGRR